MNRYRKYRLGLNSRRRAIVTIGYWLIGFSTIIMIGKHIKDPIPTPDTQPGDGLFQGIGYCIGFHGGILVLMFLGATIVSLFYRLTKTPHPFLTQPINEFIKELIIRAVPWYATIITTIASIFLFVFITIKSLGF